MAIPNKNPGIRPFLAAMLLLAAAYLAGAQPAAEPEPGDQAPTTSATISQAAEHEYMALLAKSQRPASVHWLAAGNRRFLALYEPAPTPSPKGVVILLHGSGEHPDWPGTLSTLRHYLPQVGWSTLAIALPPPDLPKPPPAKPRSPADSSSTPTAPNTSANGDESKDIFDSADNSISDGSIDFEADKPAGEGEAPGMAEEVAMDRVLAALVFLQEAGANAPIVFYGQGTGATRAVEYLFEHGDPDRQVKGLLLVGADNRLPAKDFELVQGLDNPALPVLDIYSTPSKTDAERRGNHARTREFASYRQLEVPLLANNETNIARQIHGFLRAYFDRR